MELFGLLLVFKRIFEKGEDVRGRTLGQALIQVHMPSTKVLKELVKELAAGTTPEAYLEKHGLDDKSVEDDDNRNAVHYGLRYAYHEAPEHVGSVQVLQIIPPGQLPIY